MATEIKLNERQAHFVRELLRTGDAKEAAAAAGYESSQGPLNNQNVQLKLFVEIQSVMLGKLAPKAIRFMETVLESEEYDANLKWKIASSVLDRSGFVPKIAQDAFHKAQGSLDEMKREALVAFIEQAQAQLNAPQLAPPQSNPLNNLTHPSLTEAHVIEHEDEGHADEHLPVIGE